MQDLKNSSLRFCASALYDYKHCRKSNKKEKCLYLCPPKKHQT